MSHILPFNRKFIEHLGHFLIYKQVNLELNLILANELLNYCSHQKKTSNKIATNPAGPKKIGLDFEPSELIGF